MEPGNGGLRTERCASWHGTAKLGVHGKITTWTGPGSSQGCGRRWTTCRRPFGVPEERDKTENLTRLGGCIDYLTAALQCRRALPRVRLPLVFGQQLSRSEASLRLALSRARSIRAETSLGIPIAAGALIDGRAAQEGKHDDSAQLPSCSLVESFSHVLSGQAPRQPERVVSNGVF